MPLDASSKGRGLGLGLIKAEDLKAIDTGRWSKGRFASDPSDVGIDSVFLQINVFRTHNSFENLFTNRDGLRKSGYDPVLNEA